MTKYSRHFNTKETPQSQPIPETTQVANSAGGFSWEVNDWTKLDRFLILGNEGGSYYAGERAMTVKNSEAALKCLHSDGLRMVRRIVEISQLGRAPKNDPAIFLLALAAKKGDDRTRKAALGALPLVCRIGTHLFQFVETCQQFGGWGRGLRRAVGDWYGDRATDLEAEGLAYQLIKYRQRNGWTHRDCLRLAKPRHGDIPALRWAVGKTSEKQLPKLIQGFIELEGAGSVRDVVRILAKYPGLPWEAIPSDHLKDPAVWEALLPNLPLTAMIRNLGRMTANGLIAPMSAASTIIRNRLADQERINRSRVHPVAVLAALCTYSQGKGAKGSLTWKPTGSILDALDGAFYLAFGNVEPSNKRTLLAIDCSGSMDGGEIASIPGLTPRVGAGAMAMVTARTEPNHAIVGFSAPVGGRGYGGQWGGGDPGLTPLSITPRQRLDDVCKAMTAIPMGGTDCSLPMRWALGLKMQIDTFVVYTDSETWAGPVHPVQALQQYRKATGIPAKLIVVGMVANDFTIADPNDSGMLDVVGFDTATPNLMTQFAKGD